MKKLLGLLIITCFFALNVNAQSAQDYNKAGLEQMKKYEFAKAYDSFSKAVELKADYGEAYYNRALAWFNLPANAAPEGDGCSDIQKAITLGYKVSKAKLRELGCE